MGEGEDKYLHKIHCPTCGQRLAISTIDLRKEVRCPRCQTVYVTADLVERVKTLQAVTVKKPTAAEEMGQVQATELPAPSTPLPVASPDQANMQAPFVPMEPARPQSYPYPGQVPPANGAFPAPSAPVAWSQFEPIGQPPAPAYQTPTGPPPSMPAPIQPQMQPVHSDVLAISSPTQFAAQPAYGVPGQTYFEEPPKPASFLGDVVGFGARIDAFLYGKHKWITIGGALVVILCQFINLFWNAWWLEVLAIILFTGMLFVLMFIRISSYRDAEGNWNFGLVFRRAKSSLAWLWDSIIHFMRMPKAEKHLSLAKGLFLLSALVLALRAVLQLLYKVFLWLGLYWNIGSVLTWVAVLGWLGFLFGGVFFGYSWFKLKGSLKNIIRSGWNDLASATQSVQALPPVLDFINEPNVAMQRIQHVNNPLMQNVLKQLATWKPRTSFEYEDEYQGSLHRHLKMYLPEADSKREYPIKLADSKRPRWIDIVVADFVAIEMKRDFHKSGEIQRAQGQLMENVRTWGPRGPVMLVVCDVEPGFLESTLGGLINQMRSMGYAVMAVAAGSRSRARA